MKEKPNYNMEELSKNKLVRFIKILYKILLVLDIPLVLNILYYAIITPSSFVLDKIIPSYVSTYNLVVGCLNIAYVTFLLIIAIVLSISTKIRIYKNKK